MRIAVPAWCVAAALIAAGCTELTDNRTDETVPDLTEAICADGTLGFVRNDDLNGETPKSPAEAASQQIPAKIIISCFANDGATEIGVFEIINPGGVGTVDRTR